MFSFCMYCCQTKCVSIAIAVMSTLIILFGGALIYLDSRLSNSEVWQLQTMPQTDDDAAQASQPDISVIKNTIYWGIIALSGTTILTGMLGILNARFKTCCTISFYSFLTLFLWLIFLVLGGLILTVTIASHRQLSQYCTSQGKDYDAFTLNFSRYFLNYVDDLEAATATLISTYMCTYYCPCVEVDQAKYNYIAKNSTTLSFDGFYSSFNQCYQDLVKDEKIDPLSDHLLHLIKRLEDDYQCSAVCNTPDFWFFKDIRQGPPTKNCQLGLQASYNESIGYLSIGLLATGLLVFIAFNTQYGLWRRRWTKNSMKQKQDRANNYKVEEFE